MQAHQLTGSRIREKRLDLGLRQAAVAQAVGISPSYLNLIEHNRRRIGGKLLSDLARILKVDTSLLTDGADNDLLDQMRAAAALAEDVAEVSRTEELAGRYPGWSALIAAQAQRLATLEEQVQSLTDRMSHDPQLAASLHEVISSVTAIRSSASILVEPEQLDADWQRRFHKNIYDDSVRLAASSEALVEYLDAPGAAVGSLMSPAEEVEAFLQKSDFHVASLEDGEGDIMSLATEANLHSPAATHLLKAHLSRYAKDAAAMPLGQFATVCRNSNFDPTTLMQQFDVSLPAVLRRMIAIPSEDGYPPMGLAVCDASGSLMFFKAVPGFSMPRAGAGCPLWPIYSAFSTPGQPIRAEVSMPGASATRFLCYAITQSKTQPRFDAPPILESTMLVMPDPPEGPVPPRPVGVSCRICPRQDCVARREPALTGVMVTGA